MSFSYYSFDPKQIPWQWKALKATYGVDYSLGVHEFAFCGIVGSAKTSLCAWRALDHCCRFRNARFLIGRRSYTDLKTSAFYELKEIIYATWGDKSNDWIKKGSLSIEFPWGAEIVARTWGDGKFESKFKSLNLSGAWLEEPTENGFDEYNEMMSYLRPRLSRVSVNNSDVTENLLLLSFNAHDPDHPLYKEFYESSGEKIHLFESLKRENPFLHPTYYDDLLLRLDPVQARRMVFGEWVSTRGDAIYYAYSKEKHFREERRKPAEGVDLLISLDFNIGDGKPMSCLVSQEIDGHYHILDEVIIHGSRTRDVCEELNSRGYLDGRYIIQLYGDATGKRKDTRSIASDYDIVRKFLDNLEKKVLYKFNIPRSNPAIKARHNAVNAKLENAKGQVSITIHGLPKIAEGLNKTKFKKGSSTEDDNNDYQHITTALGYMIVRRESDRPFQHKRYIER